MNPFCSPLEVTFVVEEAMAKAIVDQFKVGDILQFKMTRKQGNFATIELLKDESSDPNPCVILSEN